MYANASLAGSWVSFVNPARSMALKLVCCVSFPSRVGKSDIYSSWHSISKGTTDKPQPAPFYWGEFLRGFLSAGKQVASSTPRFRGKPTNTLWIIKIQNTQSKRNPLFSGPAEEQCELVANLFAYQSRSVFLRDHRRKAEEGLTLFVCVPVIPNRP